MTCSDFRFIAVINCQKTKGREVPSKAGGRLAKYLGIKEAVFFPSMGLDNGIFLNAYFIRIWDSEWIGGKQT